jgi:hypothetical protein
MTVPENADGHDGRPRCGARTRNGGTCGQAPGWGTSHPGSGTCKLHLGATTTHERAAHRAAAELAVAALGLEADDTPPEEILLNEIRRSHALTRFYAAQVAELDPEAVIWGATSRRITPPSTPGGQPQVVVEQAARTHPWVVLLGEERKTLRGLIETAHRCGIEERQIHLAEKYGQQISMVLQGALTRFRERWQLPAAELTWAGTVFAEQLRAIGDG